MSAPRRVAIGRVIAVLCLGLALRAGAVTVFAAGDVAQCHSQPASASPAAATARIPPDGSVVLMLGDAAYPQADSETLKTCYDPTWGRHRAHTFAVLGNHDVIGGDSDAFAAYFDSLAEHGTNDRHHFRVAVGDWWLIGLDSNLSGADLEHQWAWLASTLGSIAGDGRCIVAAWHHPLLSTGLHSGDGERMQPAWRLLSEAGADLVLNGHEHFYESFGPADAAANPSAAGMREFIVGTGGGRLSDFSLAPWRHRAFARRYGVLELTLDRDRYAWRFRSTDGETLDQGTARCRRAQSR